MAAPLVSGTAALLLATLPPGGNAALPPARQWSAEDVAKRIADRSAALCGTSSVRQIDADAALRHVTPPDLPCP